MTVGTLFFKNPELGWRGVDLAAMDPAPREHSDRFRVVSYGTGTDRGVAVLFKGSERGWINGEPVIGGLGLLADRSEILLGQTTWYYSAESRPAVVPFQLAEGKRRPRCGVCRVAIADGDLSVTCPGCLRIYHQIDESSERPAKHCFTYQPKCLCGHPTALNGATWHPDEESDHA